MWYSGKIAKSRKYRLSVRERGQSCQTFHTKLARLRRREIICRFENNLVQKMAMNGNCNDERIKIDCPQVSVMWKERENVVERL